jgi:hypothetical protein
MEAVMCDLLSEPRISFTKLAQREGVHVVTVWRWSLRGCKGHVLESFSVGGRKFTTEPAFRRWVSNINEGTKVVIKTSRQRQREIDAAKRELDEIFGDGWRNGSSKSRRRTNAK